MKKEINNQQVQAPKDIGFAATSSDNVQAELPVVPQSTNGKWEPVDTSALGFNISGDMNKPILGPDGAYYCISNSQPEYGAIQSNMNNAVPTPSSIVQLPPIVQPIALVPYASQNQPLLQYDPNYRPLEQQTPQAPRYKLKPYRGISFVQLICAMVIIELLLMLTLINGKIIEGSSIDWTTYKSHGLDLIYGLMALFGITVSPSVYYDKFLSVQFGDGLAAGFSTDLITSLMYVLIPVFTALIVIICLILVIKYLIKIVKMKSPRGFSVGALFNLIMTAAIIVMIMMIGKKQELEIKPGLSLYIVAGISLFMIIFSFFARKNAYVIDETALKKVYILDNNNN